VSTGDAPRPHRHQRLGVPSNLPEGLSSFIGRGADIARVDDLLAGTRVLTLTGAGGCGKTRLGRQVAVGAAARFPDGVWWLELASLHDGGLAADALTRVLDLPLDGGAAIEVLLEHLAAATALVVLDNCEHVSDVVADVVDRLLRGTSGVRVLATSRQPLGVEGETTWRVPSMPVPPPDTAWTTLDDYDASRLFLERLGQARPDPAPTTDAAAVVVQICRRLDGIPLALELAAARARTMTLERIVTGLDDRFRLLTGGPRQALARHQTLRASVQWSYDLLDEPERTLLRRLAVFVGGFRAEAAEAAAGFAPLSPSASSTCSCGSSTARSCSSTPCPAATGCWKPCANTATTYSTTPTRPARSPTGISTGLACSPSPPTRR
jgi:predicted ATPase